MSIVFMPREGFASDELRELGRRRESNRMQGPAGPYARQGMTTPMSVRTTVWSPGVWSTLGQIPPGTQFPIVHRPKGETTPEGGQVLPGQKPSGPPGIAPPFVPEAGTMARVMESATVTVPAQQGGAVPARRVRLLPGAAWVARESVTATLPVVRIPAGAAYWHGVTSDQRMRVRLYLTPLEEGTLMLIGRDTREGWWAMHEYGPGPHWEVEVIPPPKDVDTDPVLPLSPDVQPEVVEELGPPPSVWERAAFEVRGRSVTVTHLAVAGVAVGIVAGIFMALRRR